MKSACELEYIVLCMVVMIFSARNLCSIKHNFHSLYLGFSTLSELFFKGFKEVISW